MIIIEKYRIQSNLNMEESGNLKENLLDIREESFNVKPEDLS